MYEIPLDKANVVREGTDVTIVTYGSMVHESTKAKKRVRKRRYFS